MRPYKAKDNCDDPLEVKLSRSGSYVDLTVEDRVFSAVGKSVAQLTPAQARELALALIAFSLEADRDEP